MRKPVLIQGEVPVRIPHEFYFSRYGVDFYVDSCDDAEGNSEGYIRSVVSISWIVGLDVRLFGYPQYEDSPCGICKVFSDCYRIHFAAPLLAVPYCGLELRVYHR